jgi:UDP-glucuronate decarboxylase
VNHIFVTGGTGFFGKALLRHWSEGGTPAISGSRFTLLSRDPELFAANHRHLFANLDVRLIRGDILDLDSLKPDQYTHILHAATDSTLGLSLTPLARHQQIVNGTRNVLELALRCGKPKVLMTSSGGVYGNISQFVNGVAEDHHGMPDPLEPQNAYSVAKREAEHLCALYHDAHGLETVIARCFAFVGPDLPLNAHFAIGNFIRDAAQGREIVVQGDGTPVRSYMDQRDLAHWLSVLLIKGVACRAYNIGSSEPITIAELAHRVALLAPSRRPDVRILKASITGQAANRNFYLPDIRRVQSELHLNVQYGLDQAISNVFESICQLSPKPR